MPSKNFECLKINWPNIYQRANEAENFMYRDIDITMLKLRCFAELIVGEIYTILNLSFGDTNNFFDKLNNKHFIQIIDKKILNKLHAIRLEGNKAAHGKPVLKENVHLLCYEAYLIGQWFYKTYANNVKQIPYPKYIKPNEVIITDNIDELKNELISVKQELSQLQSDALLKQNENSNLILKLDDATLESIKETSNRAATSIDLDQNDLSNIIKLEDIFIEYDLTNDQSKLINHLTEFLDNQNSQVFLLNGYAGTGKTFITKGLTEYLDTIGRQYHLAAPTGKAAQVMSQKTHRAASTIHSLIYNIGQLKEFSEKDLDNSETYRVYATLRANTDIADTVYIIDEASMISNINNEEEFMRFGSGHLLNDLLQYINLDHNDHNKKVIFIGDNAQLPPVGMKFSPALNELYLKEHFGKKCHQFELKEVVRQKINSGILRNAMTLRESLEKKIFNQLNISCEYPDVKEIDYTNLLTTYLESCEYKVNDKAIIIAGSNSDALIYNQMVRAHFFPNINIITSKDKVMSFANIRHSGFSFPIINGMFGFVKNVSQDVENRTIVLNKKNQETNKIEKVKVILSFRNINIGFRNPLNGIAEFSEVKILENFLYSHDPQLTSDERKALYIDFLQRNHSIQGNKILLNEALYQDKYYNALRVKFGYAITCHKAQGSEWEHVLIKCSTHHTQLSEQYYRWLYTAITRSAKSLYLFNPPKIKLGGNMVSVSNPNHLPLSTNIKASDKENEKLSTAHKDTFGIPKHAHFSLKLLNKVRLLITDINIQSVILNQYHDVYFFQQEDNFARLNFYYNNKGKITSITSGQSELDYLTKELVLPLLHTTLISTVLINTEIQFEEEFQQEFHEHLNSVMSQYGVNIVQITPMDWKLRYNFSLEGNNITYDIFYNGKKQFTKINLVGKNSFPESSQLINFILTEGMGK